MRLTEYVHPPGSLWTPFFLLICLATTCKSKLGGSLACADVGVKENRAGVVNHVVLVGTLGFHVNRRPMCFPWLRLALLVGGGGRHCRLDAIGVIEEGHFLDQSVRTVVRLRALPWMLYMSLRLEDLCSVAL